MGLDSTRTATPGCARGYVLAPLRGAGMVKSTQVDFAGHLTHDGGDLGR